MVKLDKLGFAWELSAAAISERHSEGCRDDAGWEAQLAKLKKYMRKHGDCNVPQKWAEDSTLGRWVCAQREFKKKLDRGDPRPKITAAQAAKLDALGFAWTPDEARWEVQLTKLKKYKRKHGDCNVPQKGWAKDLGIGRSEARLEYDCLACAIV